MVHLLQNRLYLQGFQQVQHSLARLVVLRLLVLHVFQVHPSFLRVLVDQARRFDPEKYVEVWYKNYMCLELFTTISFSHQLLGPWSLAGFRFTFVRNSVTEYYMLSTVSKNSFVETLTAGPGGPTRPGDPGKPLEP